MNKKDLHQKILERMSSKGIDTSNIDQEKCGVINNYYHVLNKRGDLLFRFNLDKLNKSRANSNPKTKSNFLLGCGIVLAIPGFLFLFTILIPIFTVTISSFNSVSEKAKISAVKNALTNGFKECVMRGSKKLSTNFTDALSFSGNYEGFKIQSIDPNSCFKAKAFPVKGSKNTWFEININNDRTGEFSKTCGDPTRTGCEEGNTW